MYQGDLVTFLTNAVAMATEFKTDFNAVLTKLDADTLVNNTNYSALLAISSTTPAIPATLLANGVGEYDLYTTVSALQTLAQECATDYAALLAKLDLDSGVNLTTYASGNPVVAAAPNVNISATGVSKASVMDFCIAIAAFFTELSADFNAVLTKLDGDSGVTDTNYNSTRAIAASLSTTV